MILRIFPLVAALLALPLAHADDAPLRAWLERQKSITSLETKFVQERKLPALKTPTSAPGRLYFAKPDKVRWQLGEPPETLAISDGTTMTLMDVATKTARKTGVDSPQAARFSLLSGEAFHSADAFYQAFELIESRVTAGISQYTLKPKDRRMRAQIPWVFIDIDPTTNDLRALELELQDKSRIRTVFSDPKFNQKLPDTLFQPDLSGYKVK